MAFLGKLSKDGIFQPVQVKYEGTVCFILALCAVYLNERFGKEWCLSPEQSLSIHSGNWSVSRQLLVRSPKAQMSEGKLDEVKHAPSAIEQKAQGLEEIQELQKQASQAEQIKQMPEQYKQPVEQYQDKEYFEQQAKTKLMEKSVDHFAENTEALKAAQQQLQKYKRKFLHGEFETLSTVVPAYSIADDATREWEHGAMAGIGKSYKVRKGIKGNVIFMYNFLHGENSPYEKPWVIRFGFTLD